MGKTKAYWIDMKSTVWERFYVEMDEDIPLDEVKNRMWDYDAQQEETLCSDIMYPNENDGYSTVEIRDNVWGPVLWENGKSN